MSGKRDMAVSKSKSGGKGNKRKDCKKRGRTDSYSYFRNRFPHLKDVELIKKVWKENKREEAMRVLVDYDFKNNFKSKYYDKFRPEDQYKKKKCVFHIKKGDLFSSYDSLGHCVSEDLKMGKGIAPLFVKKFGQKDSLVKQAKKVGEVAVIKDKKDDRYIFFMITKWKFFNIPSYANLFKSLVEMKTLCEKLGVKRIALPKIACGLDRLDWNIVQKMIFNAFFDSAITVTIYLL